MITPPLATPPWAPPANTDIGRITHVVIYGDRHARSPQRRLGGLGIRPGENAQLLHPDDGFYRPHCLRVGCWAGVWCR